MGRHLGADEESPVGKTCSPPGPSAILPDPRGVLVRGLERHPGFYQDSRQRAEETRVDRVMFPRSYKETVARPVEGSRRAEAKASRRAARAAPRGFVVTMGSVGMGRAGRRRRRSAHPPNPWFIPRAGAELLAATLAAPAVGAVLGSAISSADLSLILNAVAVLRSHYNVAKRGGRVGDVIGDLVCVWFSPCNVRKSPSAARGRQ